MGRKSPAFSFYPDSWVMGTLGMSFEDQGVYLRMLCWQWSNGPSDANAYANACGTHYHSHVERILVRKFVCIDGLYYNLRLEEERQKQSLRSTKARESAQQRWNTEKNNEIVDLGGVNNDANAMRTQCERNAQNHAQTHAQSMHSVSVSVIEEEAKALSNKPYSTSVEQNQITSQSTDGERCTPEDVLECWEHFFGARLRMTAKRKKAIQTRLRDQWWHDHFAEALEAASKNRFCNGGNERGWTATIDWFVRPDTVTKILEGSYGGGKKNPYADYKGFSSAGSV